MINFTVRNFEELHVICLVGDILAHGLLKLVGGEGADVLQEDPVPVQVLPTRDVHEEDGDDCINMIPVLQLRILDLRNKNLEQRPD